jgi:predicted permease
MFSAVLTSVLPVCLLMALGAAFSRFRFLPDAFFEQMNRLGFWVLLPSLLFCTIAQAPAAASGTGLKIGLLLCACSVAATAGGWLTARLLGLSEPSRRSLMQSAMRGNLAYTALPVILYAFGEHAPASAVAAFALAPAIPFYNFWAVLILTRPEAAPADKACATGPAGRSSVLPLSESGRLPDPRHLLRTLAAILRNPLIIGCALGLVAMKTGLRPPGGIYKALEALGHAALPCALLALGAGLTPERLRASLRPAAAATALKLVGMPAIAYLLARAAGVSGEALLITLLYAASPCAVTSYVMADQMGADRDLAGSAIALSTLLCLPVMALILACCR